TTTVGSFQRPDSIELLVWDLAYAALADAEAGPTGFVLVSVVADAEAGLTSFVMVSAVADAEAVPGLTGFLMVSADPVPKIL
ncbi:hypothetical protein A2U01_0071079, partial [Trifolium medium]|nr:hypothetical protein [Trifolium medium]